jgi:hypothetical protein
VILAPARRVFFHMRKKRAAVDNPQITPRRTDRRRFSCYPPPNCIHQPREARLLKLEVFDEDFVGALCVTYVANTGMAAELDLAAEECVAILKHLLIKGG